MEEVKEEKKEDRVEEQDEEKNLQDLYLKFLEEKKQFQEEMKFLNKRVLEERKRLKEEELFFEKKMAILQNGFQELERDRQQLEMEKKRMKYERVGTSTGSQRTTFSYDSDDLGAVLFRGVSNPMALRKRYRELVKIFHPDNFGGDEQIMELINREYAKRKEEY